MTRALAISLALLTELSLHGCRAPSAAPAPVVIARAPALSMVRTELYFGLARKDGPDVTDAEWRAFVDESITPRFPDGLTVLDARGQWRGPDGVIVREPSRVVMILHSATDDADAKLDQIRADYVRRFNQDAVMRTDSPARVSF